MDAPGLTVAGMAAKIQQIQAGQLKEIPIRVVTVDHLGLIGGDRKMSTYDRLSTQVRELKELAKHFNVSVLIALQVNRESGGDGSKEFTSVRHAILELWKRRWTTCWRSGGSTAPSRYRRSNAPNTETSCS